MPSISRIFPVERKAIGDFLLNKKTENEKVAITAGTQKSLLICIQVIIDGMIVMLPGKHTTMGNDHCY
jgi:DNA-binding transcriptional MocR family regulator